MDMSGDDARVVSGDMCIEKAASILMICTNKRAIGWLNLSSNRHLLPTFLAVNHDFLCVAAIVLPSLDFRLFTHAPSLNASRSLRKSAHTSHF